MREANLQLLKKYQNHIMTTSVFGGTINCNKEKQARVSGRGEANENKIRVIEINIFSR